jgi:hypothetical protein
MRTGACVNRVRLLNSSGRVSIFIPFLEEVMSGRVLTRESNDIAMHYRFRMDVALSFVHFVSLLCCKDPGNNPAMA